MNPKRIAAVLALSLMTAAAAFGQLSEGGTPPSFNARMSEEVSIRTMGSVDVEALLTEDEVEAAEGLPYRFGHPFDVSWDLMAEGQWDELPNGGKICRLRIECPGAYSINLLYRDFWLPEGARLWVYSEDRRHVLGAFSAANNKDHLEFATAPVAGDVTIVEYYEPAGVAEHGSVVISRVVHAYKDIFNYAGTKGTDGFGSSGSCNNNVNCPEGEPWQLEKRAVAMVLLSSGTRWCSGAMINNVRRDQTPYFLTANHCLGGESTWIFMFRYESPSCANVDGPTNYTLQGSTRLANFGTSDFALLELQESPPDSFNIYFCGWSAVDQASTSSVGIHHPSGDIKKISFDYNAVTSANYLSTSGTTHWRVGNWEDGTTEGGSSGSPLFDPSHRIVGQLHGGYASCTSITADWYGKFSLSWNGGGSSSNQLSCWLDPDSTGVTTLDGYDPFAGAEIVHDPLTDTRDSLGPYTIIAEITSVYGFDADSTIVYYRTDGAWVPVTMAPTGVNDDYSADLPGQLPGTEIDYYIWVKDLDENVDSTDVLSFRVIDYGVALTPDEDTASGAIGDTIWYELTVTNDGLYDDTYQLTAYGNGWEVSLWDSAKTSEVSSSGLLAYQDSYPFTVSVLVPSSLYGDTDEVAIIATSDGDPVRTDSTVLATMSTGGLGVYPWADEFSDATPDPVRWIINAGAEVNTEAVNPPSPPCALNLDGGVDTLISQPIDLSGQSGTVLTYFVERGGSGNVPSAGNDLYVEYWHTSGYWQILALHIGGAADTEFELHAHQLPGAAIHPEFQLRFRSTGDCEDCDDWYIDNVRLDQAPAMTLDPTSFAETLVSDSTSTVQLGIDNGLGGYLDYHLSIQPAIPDESAFGQLLASDLVEASRRVYSTEVATLSLPKGNDTYSSGEQVLYDAGGPDDFGNYWIDSDDPSGPTFEWIDVSATGTDIVGQLDDDTYAGPFAIGFDFPYYGATYQQVYVGANGLIGFASDNIGSRLKTSIPNSGTPNDMIALLWDDLDPDNENNTDPHVYVDTTGGRCTIQFVDYPEYGAAAGDVMTAQVVIEPNGFIKLHYLSIAPGFDAASCAVGIENADGTDGLEVVFAAPYLHDSLAVWIYQPSEWLTADRIYGSVESGYGDMVELTIDATGLDSGTYQANLIVTSNDPDPADSSVIVPVVLEVTGGGSNFVCGDANGDGGGPDIADLIYLVSYMFQQGPVPPELDAVDVNNDGIPADIADLVHLVGYMFQQGDPLDCP